LFVVCCCVFVHELERQFKQKWAYLLKIQTENCLCLVCLFACLFVCSFVYVFVCLFVCLFVSLVCVRLGVWLFACLVGSLFWIKDY